MSDATPRGESFSVEEPTHSSDEVVGRPMALCIRIGGEFTAFQRILTVRLQSLDAVVAERRKPTGLCGSGMRTPDGLRRAAAI